MPPLLVAACFLACSACGLSSTIRAEATNASRRIDAENDEIARKEAAYGVLAARRPIGGTASMPIARHGRSSSTTHG